MRVLSVVHHRNAAAGVFAEPAARGRPRARGVAARTRRRRRRSTGSTPRSCSAARRRSTRRTPTPGCAPRRSSWPSCSSAARRCWASASARSCWPAPAGAVVRRAAAPEIGWNEIELTPQGAADPLLGFLPERFSGFGWHHYEWLLPPGAVALARSAACLQAFRLEERPVWGIQFHPEVTARRSRLLARHLGRRPRRGGHRPRPRGDPRRERRADRRLERGGPRDLAALPRRGGGAQSSGVRYAPLRPPSTMKVDAFT